MEIVGKIVLTGGPCAGKTTALARIEKNLTELGYKVFIVSESATELIKGGIRPFGDRPIDIIKFQSLIINHQLSKEKIYEEAALSIDEKSVIIYDRGFLDNKAYIDYKIFKKLLKEKDLCELDLLDNYDMVIHLVTAADGKAEYYTLANNEARSESVEEAIELDRRTANAWAGHNNLKIVDNSTDFDAKIDRVLFEVNSLVNPHKRIKQQRKFIVDIGDAELELINNLASTTINITQTYIESSKDIYERRIRERRHGQDITHFMTVQKKKENGVSDVLLDKKISSKEYESLLTSSSDVRTINKTRISFIYKKNVYRLDIFESGLAILELDITEGSNKLELPKGLNIIEEVTEKEEFRNFVLANSSVPVHKLSKSST